MSQWGQDPYGQVAPNPGVPNPGSPAQPQGYRQPQGQGLAQPQGYAQPQGLASVAQSQGYVQPVSYQNYPDQGQYAVQHSGSQYSQGPLLVDIGAIRIVGDTVYTPAGNIALQHAQFTIADQTHARRQIPTWAIVCAIVGFFIVTVFSLLFLLAKEDRLVGEVTVGVSGPGLSYFQPFAANGPEQVQDLYQRVNYANSLVRGY